MPKRGTILIDYIALCYQVKEIKISSWQGDILGFNTAYFDYRALEKKKQPCKTCHSYNANYRHEAEINRPSDSLDIFIKRVIQIGQG